MSAASQAIDQAVAQAAQEQQGATSTAPIDRGTEPVTGPTDPRFDRDDLRQGHPPPAVRQGKLRVSVKRLRKNKGTPYDAATEKDAKHDEAELTEEEVEVDEHEENDKKPGLVGKLLGKN